MNSLFLQSFWGLTCILLNNSLFFILKCCIYTDDVNKYYINAIITPNIKMALNDASYFVTWYSVHFHWPFMELRIQNEGRGFIKNLTKQCTEENFCHFSYFGLYHNFIDFIGTSSIVLSNNFIVKLLSKKLGDRIRLSYFVRTM